MGGDGRAVAESPCRAPATGGEGGLGLGCFFLCLFLAFRGLG
jgi:hypothetical protein